MSKIINTCKQDLLSLDVGGVPLEYKKKSHRSYLTTASNLKKSGEGEWHCNCKKGDKVGQAYRIK